MLPKFVPWIPEESRELEHSREPRERFYEVVGSSSIDRQHFMANNNDRNAIPGQIRQDVIAKGLSRPRRVSPIIWKSMSRRGMHPLLMGNHKPERKTDENKKPDLSGYESAQRKRFLRTEEEESRQSNNSWIQALLPEMMLITMSLEVVLPWLVRVVGGFTSDDPPVLNTLRSKICKQKPRHCRGFCWPWTVNYL